MTGSLRDMVAYLRTKEFTVYFLGLRKVEVKPNEEVIRKIKQYARKIQKDGVGSSCTDKGASK